MPSILAATASLNLLKAATVAALLCSVSERMQLKTDLGLNARKLVAQNIKLAPQTCVLIRLSWFLPTNSHLIIHRLKLGLDSPAGLLQRNPVLCSIILRRKQRGAPRVSRLRSRRESQDCRRMLIEVRETKNDRAMKGSTWCHFRAGGGTLVRESRRTD